MNTVILGYDDSEPSQRALERAVQLTKAFQSKLVVTSVAPIRTGTGRMGGIDPTEPLEQHIHELYTARERLEAQGIQAEYQPALGQPADTIVELAEQRHADMIIVGTREVNVIQRLLGQSVSETVAHKTHCDVLIVH